MITIMKQISTLSPYISPCSYHFFLKVCGKIIEIYSFSKIINHIAVLVLQRWELRHRKPA